MDVDREHIDLNAANNYLNSENSDFFGSQSESSSVVTNQNDLPFFFADRRTPVILEPIFLPLLLILAAILLGFCLILPGIRGRQRVFAALRFFMLGSAGLWIFFR